MKNEPALTFTSMCEYLGGASPVRQLSILRAQKFPTDGPMKSYVATRSEIRKFAIDGKALDPASLREYEAEAIQCLLDNDWSPPASECTAPPAYDRKLILGNVEIKAYPDLLCRDPQTDRSGAVKFYFGKSRQLSAEAGQMMANLLYYFESEVIRSPNAHHSLCVVYDARQGVEYVASRANSRLINNVAAACTMISAIWPGLSA